MSTFNTSNLSLDRADRPDQKKFYGKYRAYVTNNNDKKEKMGRIKVKCPKVLGESESNWCSPCVPFGAMNRGFAFIPNVGDSVWVEFEEGDPNKPIYSGGWWALNEMPDVVYKKIGYHHVIQTRKATIHIDDEQGKIIIDGNVEINGTLKHD